VENDIRLLLHHQDRLEDRRRVRRDRFEGLDARWQPAEPALVERVREIVLMGGGFFEGGNVTPAAEFNIYVDPHAAAIVFNAGIPITMASLDVTHRALTNRERVEAIRVLGTPAATAAAEWLDFFERFDAQKYGSAGGPLHDPCVIAWLLKPELFSGRLCNVSVETTSELTMGMTVIDWWGVTALPKNAFVLRDIDAQGFFDLITAAIARLG